MKQLAVGIPTMNRPDMLGELLDDIRTYQPTVPVIISDNSDEDSTQRLVEKYSDSLNINYIRVKERLSQAENFNVILSSASAEFIIMMHDDDRFLPNSFENYLSLISYFKNIQENIIAAYFLSAKFRNLETLKSLTAASKYGSSREEIAAFVQVFEKSEYIRYFVEYGNGGRAPGVLLNCSLMKKLQLTFPTDAGAKHDKAFFLSANSVGSIAQWPCRIIARRLHPDQSIRKNVTQNYCLFNQKLSEIYANDSAALNKVHEKRFEKWVYDESRFRPIDCCRLLKASSIPLYKKVSLFCGYLFRRCFLIFS